LAGLTHYSAGGIAVGSASLFDAHAPIGASMTTAAANSNFGPPSVVDERLTGQ
jgi:hypothetical protein